MVMLNHPFLLVIYLNLSFFFSPWFLPRCFCKKALSYFAGYTILVSMMQSCFINFNDACEVMLGSL